MPGVVGGSEGYATGLLERLVERDDVSVIAFALPGFVTQVPVVGRGRTHRRRAAARGPPRRPAGAGRKRLAAKPIAASAEIGLVHHLGGIVPPRCRVPAVVTLHDLQYLAYPRVLQQREAPVPRTSPRAARCKRARAVTGDQRIHPRAQAIDAFDLDADKVHVVPPVDTRHCPRCADRPTGRRS